MLEFVAMIEVKGDLWTYPADIRVITTNGFVKANGECVMGRGCAKEAKDKFPWLPKNLGDKIKAMGNIPFHFPDSGLYTFPVKHNWYEKADIELIRKSAQTLFHMAPVDAVIVLPRPGCGNGQLKWEDVKPILEPILDNRFHIITKE
jgi:hypothetical protein